MREKSKAMEDKVAQLMESYTAAKTNWDKEVDGECEKRQCDSDIFMSHVMSKEKYLSLNQDI